MSSERQAAGALELRIGELERSNRSLARVASSALALALFLLFVQFLAAIRPDSAGERIESREFLLTDTEGRERASLGIDSDGRTGLLFYDLAGKRRARVGVEAGGIIPSLQLFDETGRLRAGLALLNDDRAQLSFTGSEGPPRLLLTSGLPAAAGGGESGTAPADTGRIVLRDGEGRPVFTAP